jgi:hypothetical protein
MRSSIDIDLFPFLPRVLARRNLSLRHPAHPDSDHALPDVALALGTSPVPLSS